MSGGKRLASTRLPLVVNTKNVQGANVELGGLHAGTSIEFSRELAAHYNAAAAQASGVIPGEFLEFAAGEYFSIAITWKETPKESFISEYGRLRVVIDGSHEIRLADHPRLFSYSVDDPKLVQGSPTYIQKSHLPSDFFRKSHSVELFHNDSSLFGPVERFFHSPRSGVIYNLIEDAPGKLVLEVQGNFEYLAKRGHVIFFSDPAFGEPTAVVQVESKGMAMPCDWEMLGRDRIGDTALFNEWLARVEPLGKSMVIEVSFPNKGRGVAGAIYGGHTRDTAYRVDARVT